MKNKRKKFITLSCLASLTALCGLTFGVRSLKQVKAVGENYPLISYDLEKSNIFGFSSQQLYNDEPFSTSTNWGYIELDWDTNSNLTFYYVDNTYYLSSLNFGGTFIYYGYFSDSSEDYDVSNITFNFDENFEKLYPISSLNEDLFFGFSSYEDSEDSQNNAIVLSLINGSTHINYFARIHEYSLPNFFMDIIDYSNPNFTKMCILRASQINATYKSGYDTGYLDGYREGENTGYQKGYNDGVNSQLQEDYSIGGLIGSIFKAPFDFIDGLNFEIFGLNVKDLLLLLLTVGLVVAIIGIFKGRNN